MGYEGPGTVGNASKGFTSLALRVEVEKCLKNGPFLFLVKRNERKNSYRALTPEVTGKICRFARIGGISRCHLMIEKSRTHKRNKMQFCFALLQCLEGPKNTQLLSLW